MSITNIKIDPIPAESTPGGFLRAARLLPEGVDWKGGVTFTESCGGAERAGCSYGVDVYNASDKGDPVEFDPFMVGAMVKCSGSPDLDDLKQLAQIRLRRGMSSQFAQELHTSHADVGNPDLVSTGVDITPGSPPCMNNAIAGLMTVASSCGGGELTFHVPLVGLASLMNMDLVEFSDGRYRLGGHTVIVDDYPNAGPTGSPAPAANEVYVWATGPVEYAVGQNANVDHFTGVLNEGIVLAQNQAILRFDPCCVHAILAEIC